MPGGNKTGPEGDGPMTGRRMGNCIDNEHPGNYYSNSNRGGGYGRGFRGGWRARNVEGRGMGFRFGNRRFLESPVQNVSEKTLIENQIRILKDQLSGLEEQLTKLNKD